MRGWFKKKLKHLIIMKKLKVFEVGYWKQRRDGYENFSENVLANSPEDAKKKLMGIDPSAKLLTIIS